jgi:hypothetical protein
MFRSVVEGVSLCGGEMWSLNQKFRNKIATTKFHYLRMRLHVIRENRMRNKAVCEETDVASAPVRNLGNRAL